MERLTAQFALSALPAIRTRLAMTARALDGPSVAGSLGIHVVFGCLLLMMPRPGLDKPEPPLNVVMVDLPPIEVEPPPPPKPPPPKPAPNQRMTAPIRQTLPPPIANAPQIAPLPQIRLPDPVAEPLPRPLAPTVTASELTAPKPISVPQMPPTPQLTTRSEITPITAPPTIAPLATAAPSIPDPTLASSATPLANAPPRLGPIGDVKTPTLNLPDDEPATPNLAGANTNAPPNPGVNADDERKRAEAEAARRAAALKPNGGDEPIATAGGAAPPSSGGLRGSAGPNAGGAPAGGGAPAIQGFAIGGLNDGPGDCTDPTNPALTDAQRAACNLRWRGVRGLAPVSGVSARDRATFESDLAAKNRGRSATPATVACKDNLGGDCLPDKR